MKSTFNEIKEFFYEKLRNEKLSLTRNTRLYEDLKIDGDDAFELLQSYQQKFNVDMNDFNYSDYFSSEGIDIFGALKSLFNSKKIKLKELTLGDLEIAAIKGKWSNDEK